MKFKKPTEYVPRAHEEPGLKPEDPMFFRYECVFCANYAALLHRGSSYCRRCYEEHNRLGRLIN